MNTQVQVAVASLISAHKEGIFNLSLAQISKVLGLPDRYLDRIERACDPERGTAYEASEFVEFEGEKSLMLWCLTESFLYDYTPPDNARAFIASRFCRPRAIDTLRAQIIVDFFTMLEADASTSYKKFTMKPTESIMENIEELDLKSEAPTE